MNKLERTKMIKAMEFIARNINSEDVFECWLVNGVADGDIEYGDLAAYAESDANDVEYFLDDEHFADLMETFLWCMAKAKRDGGLACDRVVSRRCE